MWISEACFKVYNLVSVYPKGIILNQMTTLNVNFYVVMSAYRWFKFKTCLSSLSNFWMASRRPLSKAKSSGRMEWRDVLCVTSLQSMWFLNCNPLRTVSVTSVVCVYVYKGIVPASRPRNLSRSICRPLFIESSHNSPSNQFSTTWEFLYYYYGLETMLTLTLVSAGAKN